MNDDREFHSLTPLPKTEPKLLTFPQAMEEVIQGNIVTRLSWTSQTSYALLKDNWLMIYIDGDFHVWSINDGDLLTMDWIVMTKLNG